LQYPLSVLESMRCIQEVHDIDLLIIRPLCTDRSRSCRNCPAPHPCGLLASNAAGSTRWISPCHHLSISHSTHKARRASRARLRRWGTDPSTILRIHDRAWNTSSPSDQGPHGPQGWTMFVHLRSHQAPHHVCQAGRSIPSLSSPASSALCPRALCHMASCLRGICSRPARSTETWCLRARQDRLYLWH
jgi:hypothetical protein